MLTQVALGQILASSLKNVDMPILEVGLCDCVFDSQLQVADAGEPVIGTGGYQRQVLNPTAEDWPTAGTLNGMAFLESKAIVFPAGNYSCAASRLFLKATGSADVFALGSAFPAPLQITTTTDLASRTFKYRMYLR